MLCYCVIMMHCLRRSICDSHLSEDDLNFVLWKWNPRKTGLPFLTKIQLSKGFYWSVDLKFQKKMVVNVEDNTQLLENFPHVDDMLLCLYKYSYNLNKFGNRHKHKQNCGIKTQTVITKLFQSVRKTTG